MPELRKLIKLNPITFAITIPVKYRVFMGLQVGDYVQISMGENQQLILRKAPNTKP